MSKKNKPPFKRITGMGTDQPKMYDEFGREVRSTRPLPAERRIIFPIMEPTPLPADSDYGAVREFQPQPMESHWSEWDPPDIPEQEEEFELMRAMFREPSPEQKNVPMDESEEKELAEFISSGLGPSSNHLT